MRGVYRKVAVLATVCALLGGVCPATARPLSAYREYDSALFSGTGFKLSLPRKGKTPPIVLPGGEEAISPELLPLSVSSFRSVSGGPIMPRRVAEAVRGLDAEGRRQLEASLLLLLKQYEEGLKHENDEELKNNMAGAYNFLFGAAWRVLKEGQELSVGQQRAMLRQINAAFALGFQDRRLSDREKQELYESAVLGGSIIRGLASEGRESSQPALQRAARELANSLLRRLMGLTIEQVRPEGNAMAID